MSRKSSASAVTLIFFHVAPPSSVRNTVLPEPLAHATRSLTALTPRKRAVTPLVCSVQCGAKTKSRKSEAIRLIDSLLDSGLKLHQPPMIDHETSILHNLNTGFSKLLRNFVVIDAELHPD